MKRQLKKTSKLTPKELRKLERQHDRSYNPIAHAVKDANEALLDRLHELLFYPLFVCGPDGFVADEDGLRRATDAESRETSIDDYGEPFRVKLFGDIPAQVIAGLQARIKLHQAAIRRIRAAGKRGELVAVRPKRKAVK